jgi:hypothetical protein
MPLPDDRYSDQPGDRDADRYSDQPARRREDQEDDFDYEPRRNRFRREDVPNYLVPAILVTLFCCLLGGIVSIVYAAQANSKAAAGDYEGAIQAANQAKTWLWVSFVIGLVATLIQIAAIAGGGL